ncbi:hypothetical protein MMC16_003231 [Acarospora aff. strigata]|nr:hypothetical protein [Acarospora aff. strigata]
MDFIQGRPPSPSSQPTLTNTPIPPPDYIATLLPFPLSLLTTYTRSRSASSTYTTYLTSYLQRSLAPYIPAPVLTLLSPLTPFLPFPLSTSTSNSPLTSTIVQQLPFPLSLLATLIPSQTPSLATLALLLALFLISLKTLGMLRRMLFYWVALAVKLVVWGVVAVGAMWVWNRGLEGSVEDLAVVIGAVQGEARAQGRGRGSGSGRGWDARRERGGGRWA